MVKLAAASYCSLVPSAWPLNPGESEETEGETHPIENVHQLALLHRANHDRTTFRIRREVLPGDDPPRARTAIRLLVQFFKLVGRGIVLEDDYPTRIGTDDDVV
jgi:hypothetical protein